MAVAVVLAVLGAAALGVGVLNQRPSPPSAQVVAAARPLGSTTPTPQPTPTADAGKGSAAQDVDTPTPSSGRVVPTSVSIPRLGVSESLVRLGLNADGTLEVPQDPAKPGWYTKAPTPGEIGPSVIAGHVTWNGEPAVFFELAKMRIGDEVEVDRKDGSTAVFEVTRTQEVLKDEFPTDDVYGFVDYPALRLITCGGRYDAKAKRYLSNFVVYAKLVSIRPAAA